MPLCRERCNCKLLVNLALVLAAGLVHDIVEEDIDDVVQGDGTRTVHERTVRIFETLNMGNKLEEAQDFLMSS